MNFTLIAYFLKPICSALLYLECRAKNLPTTDQSYLLNPSTTITLQEQLLNATSLNEMIALLDNFVFSLITKVKTSIKLVEFATDQIVRIPPRKCCLKCKRNCLFTERTFQRTFEKTSALRPINIGASASSIQPSGNFRKGNSGTCRISLLKMVTQIKAIISVLSKELHQHHA
jgi:hypothetical protein